MAEDKDESQEKSQEPTARRLQKAKEDGKVLSSKEVFVFSSTFMGVFLKYVKLFFHSGQNWPLENLH